ncbi:DUF4328 domain-containing protein [Actinomadura sp. LD22]|uniref:DUF4328 domain-containing protein n=1 Tax=Actinomadura physcomitrii TaxID=2650748 RepID=A0A6I4MBU7_9ACTN|nr:DUF4328 domain-containing protein [Actinomadura physcomitrii]MWA03708.1 DUF4328 domain-containing protein [Actinomadura physcomitrii]
MYTTPTEVLKPPRAAALVAIAGLGTNALVMLALAGLGLRTNALLGGEGLTSRTADLRNGLVAGSTAQLVLTVLTGIAVIVWLWRARTAAEVIEEPEGWGRPWVIAGWFVPVLNFWIPRNVVASVWRASAPHGKPPWPVNVWWAAFVVWALVGRLGDGDPTGTPGHIHQEITLRVVDWALGIPAALMAALVVWRITRFQEAQAVRLALAVAAPPAPPAPDAAPPDLAVSDPA